MPSIAQAAAALRALVAPFATGCVSNEEFDRRLAVIDGAIADVRGELEDVRSQVDELYVGPRVVELALDLDDVRKWAGSE